MYPSVGNGVVWGTLITRMPNKGETVFHVGFLSAQWLTEASGDVERFCHFPLPALVNVARANCISVKGLWNPCDPQTGCGLPEIGPKPRDIALPLAPCCLA